MRVGALLSCFVLAACAASTFDGARYEGGGFRFRTGPTPASWQRLEATHALLAFRDEAAEATVMVNGRCGKDGDDVPLAALTQHLFLNFTEREIESEDTLPFDGREARRTVLAAKLDGVPKRFETLVAKKDGCVYDFVLISAPATFDRSRPAFDGFVGGFHAEQTP